MNTMNSSWIKKASGLWIPVMILVFILAAGCGPSQKEIMAKDQMERARLAYGQAKADKNVEALAPIPLADAGKALQAAEQAKDPEQQTQLGYIAERRAQIAQTSAEGKMAEQALAKINKETSDLIVEKRTQEARIAQQESEKAQQESEKAKSAAAAGAEQEAKAKAEAERARADAERARADAERARMAAKVEADRAAQAKAEADQLTKEMSNLKAQQTERGIVLTMGEVLFATGKSNLSSEAFRNVDKLAEFLQKHPERNLLIEGHTDSTGSDELNMTLSQKRADAVKEALVGKGVSEVRITTRGYGKKYPLASNDTPAGRSQNRRVEVIILNEGVKAETQFRQ